MNRPHRIAGGTASFGIPSPQALWYEWEKRPGGALGEQFPRFSLRLLLIALVVAATLWGTAPMGRAAEADELAIKLEADQRARCLRILRQGMRAEEFWPSIHAAEALTLAGHGGEVIRYLAPKLPQERDDQRRCGLARELVRAGDRAQAAVMLDILQSDDPHGHTHAAESLYKVAEIGDGRAMRDAMRQEQNVPQRLMAAAALARCGSLEALALVRRHVSHDDPMIARIAAWILARVGDKSDIADLRTALTGQDEALTRAYFEHALAALGDADGRRALVRNLSHADAAVRTYAATFAGDGRVTEAAGQLLELLDDEALDVRIRAAQSLLVLAGPDAPEDAPVVADVLPASAEHPRNSEGSIVALRDGTLLLAATRFGGRGSDFDAAQIVACRSRDGGRTWSEPEVLQENVGAQNVMSVTLRYLAQPLRENTPLGMFYLIKNGYDDLKVWLRISNDHGVTFGKPTLVTDLPGYHVLNNDRVTLLNSGRLLVPVASTADVHKENHFVSFCFLSDDQGRSWRVGRGRVDLPKRGAMEPEVIELRDGRVLMILRTQLGRIAASYSSDGGDTWSEPELWETLDAPESPATLRRIPSTGDLLLVWNNNYEAGAGHGGRRTPLTAAISQDEGASWKHIRNLETSDDQTFAYTSLKFFRGQSLLSYYVRDEANGRISLRFRSLPVQWFYGE